MAMLCGLNAARNVHIAAVMYTVRVFRNCIAVLSDDTEETSHAVMLYFVASNAFCAVIGVLVCAGRVPSQHAYLVYLWANVLLLITLSFRLFGFAWWVGLFAAGAAGSSGFLWFEVMW